MLLQQITILFTVTIVVDFSSSAFFIVLTVLMDNSELIIRNVNVNSSRTGYTLNWDKGRYRYMGVSTASNTFFYYPWGISYDHSNNRIIT